ncbi:MAG: DNA primase [Candidatus Dasytiphilus stammeri]
MIGKITRSFINNLLNCTDIVHIINARIKLKQYGKNYKAYCPFHLEKNPSFIVNKERQFFYCFGCGKHGNIIDFLMYYDHLGFIESIEELSMIYGLKIQYEDNNKNIIFHNRYSLYQIMEEITDFYQQSLLQKNSGQAREYLNQRGISTSIEQSFAIGFAPDNFNTLINLFGLYSKKYSLLVATGMVVANNTGKIYDRFRNRIMFPIRDKLGRVLGFGGRILGLENNIPKYINSPETIIFNKARNLYGIYEISSRQRAFKCILVVEGYIDVITLAQYGIDYAVAILGTNPNIHHIQTIFSNTNHIIYCADGDLAGRKGAWRFLKIALSYMFDGRQLSFILLPDGEDPDSLIRKEGKNFFEKKIEQARSFTYFMFEILLSQVNTSTPDGRARFSYLIIPLIKKVPGNILRFYLREMLAEKLKIRDKNKMVKLLPMKVVKHKSLGNLRQTTIRILISLLVQNPHLAVIVPELAVLTKIKLSGLPIFISLVKKCITYPQITTWQLLELYRTNEKLFKYLKMLAIWDNMIVYSEIENMFKDIINNILDLALKQRQENLIALARSKKLSIAGRYELWFLNKSLAKIY